MDNSGSSVGIILPSDADDEVFDLLESILYGVISQPTGEAIADWRSRKETEPSEDYSTRISNKIVNGNYLSFLDNITHIYKHFFNFKFYNLRYFGNIFLKQRLF